MWETEDKVKLIKKFKKELLFHLIRSHCKQRRQRRLCDKTLWIKDSFVIKRKQKATKNSNFLYLTHTQVVPLSDNFQQVKKSVLLYLSKKDKKNNKCWVLKAQNYFNYLYKQRFGVRTNVRKGRKPKKRIPSVYSELQTRDSGPFIETFCTEKLLFWGK